MVKAERLSRPVLTALFVLAVFLIAVFALSADANADGLDVDVAADTDTVSTLSSYFSGIGLRNTEYPDANFINFLLCLHGYENLPADATVTVTAYLPVTNTVFWRSTFTKDYLALKDDIQLVTHGSLIRLPGACTLKIEVNGANIKGWDLIYGNTVEEAIIWNPSSGFTGVAADYVPGNATYMFMSNVGGHVVHLNIDSIGSGSNPGGDNPGGDNPGGSNPGGDNPGGDNPGGDNPGGNNPGGDNPGGDNPGGDNPGGDNPGGDKPGKPDDPNTPDKPGKPDDPNTPDKPSNPDDPNTPDKPSNPDNPNTPDKPNNPDNPNTPDKPTESKTPSETGDTRSVVMMSAIAVISLAVLAGTYRKKKPN